MRRVLVTGSGYTSAHFEKLKDADFEILHHEEDLNSDQFRSLLSSVDAHILGGSERVTCDDLVEAPRLKLISFVGTGIGAFVDEAAAANHGVIITNTPGIMTAAVAEHTIGLILGVRRHLFSGNTSVKASRAFVRTSSELSAATVGIVGMGAIGERVTRMLRGCFGCRVQYHSRTRKVHLEEELGVDFVSLEEIFTECDVIVLMIPTSAETRNIANAELLSRAKRRPLLINTAGASLVDPAALKRALETDVLGAAAFDGYYIEPLPAIDADPYQLLALSDDRFVVTPHTAAKTPQSWQRMVDLAVENAIQFFPRSEATSVAR